LSRIISALLVITGRITMRKRNKKVAVAVVMICSPIRERWRERGIMDYELRIIVEKVAISSQEVITRDTITSYALQCPTSIVELGLRHAEQVALLEKVQNIVLAEQSRLLDPGMPVCPTCGSTLKKNGYKGDCSGETGLL
jgi:hypothetical protein